LGNRENRIIGVNMARLKAETHEEEREAKE